MTINPSLSQRINTLTRPYHTHLNALILSLLPLALPPYTPDPDLYFGGIRHILPIYEAFEEEYRLLLAQLEEGGGGHKDGKQLVKYSDNERGCQGVARADVVHSLNRLFMPELERSSRLHQDISTLPQYPATLNPGSIPNSSALPRLAGFRTHIHATLSLHPHLLLAYTWIFYMALFSGGRYIRAQLRQAGPEFWNPRMRDEKCGNIDNLLSFWTFDGDLDGEEFRAKYKREFLEVERSLTEGEKEQVVQEAVYIMGALIGIVEEISGRVGENRCAKQAEPAAWQEANTKRDAWLDDDNIQSQERDEPSMQWLLLKYILPMGMAELVSEAANMLMLGLRSSKAVEDGEI